MCVGRLHTFPQDLYYTAWQDFNNLNQSLTSSNDILNHQNSIMQKRDQLPRFCYLLFIKKETRERTCARSFQSFKSVVRFVHLWCFLQCNKEDKYRTRRQIKAGRQQNIRWQAIVATRVCFQPQTSTANYARSVVLSFITAKRAIFYYRPGEKRGADR